MLAKISLFLVMVGISTLLIVGGCAGSKLKVEPISTSENPTEQINLLTSQIDEARRGNVDLLSPTWFVRAKSSLGEATQLRKQGENLSGILQAVAVGQAQIKKANEITQIARTALPRAIKARDDARSVGATRFKQEYVNVEKKFLKLTKSIENNDLEWAKEKEEEVAQNFRDLELRAIKEQAIGEIRNMIQQAEAEGARKIAPQSLEFSKKKLKEADEFISRNRYQKDPILQKADEARFYAHRLLQVTQESKKIKAMEPEQITLWMEFIITDIGKELAAPDMRDRSLATQVKNIHGAIATLQQDQETMVVKARTQQEELTSRMKAQQEQLDAEAKAQEAELEMLKKQLESLQGRSQEERETKGRLEAEMARAKAQQEELAGRARAQQAELEKQKIQMEALRGQTQTEQEAKLRLEAEVRFNELFKEVQTYFEPDEAEVYKQGDLLLIRLKGMQFPVGQHVLNRENFSLLSKVQRAIRTFDEPYVVVEGHTDSTGSDTANEKLSRLRAEAVLEYLVANENVKREKIEAMGFGSQKPVAPNETLQGRALNRRIDVIIRPESKFVD